MSTMANGVPGSHMMVCPGLVAPELDAAAASLENASLPCERHYRLNPEETAQVTLDRDVSFAYVIRRDGALTIPPIVERLLRDDPVLDIGRVSERLRHSYEECCRQVCQGLLTVFVSRANENTESPQKRVELHIFDPHELEAGVMTRARGGFVVSMDPMVEGDLPLQVSRLFCLGGVADLGIANRPGTPLLEDQIAAINAVFARQAQNLEQKIEQARASGSPELAASLERRLDALRHEGVKLVDDDMFTGGTVAGIIRRLKAAGVSVTEVIPQLQAGAPADLAGQGVKVTPVVKYALQDRDQLDLGDLRDFIVGVSGLVVKLPSGGRGRAPYVLPWVSPTARASVPPDLERSFSIAVLNANLKFYENATQEVGTVIRLSHLDPHFAAMMCELYGFEMRSPMVDVIRWALKNVDRVARVNENLGFMQERLEQMALPHKMVFLDVNGTLFPDDSQDGAIAPENLAALREQIGRLNGRGIAVGLCSDTPLSQLQVLARELQCDGPIFAENGNILSHDGKELIVRELPFWREIRMAIEKLGSRRYKKVPDCLAPEFGGVLPDFSKGQWAFGQGRTASLTVFGPSEFIAGLPEKLVSELGNKIIDSKQFSFDCSPQHNFFAVHPGQDFRLNKRESLDLLSQFDERSIMLIGNSKADLTKGDVACAFVNDAGIDDEMRRSAVFISEKADIDGVIDILGRISG